MPLATTAPPVAGAMAASSSERSASGSGVVGCAGGDESACSTPFVSAPSSPARDPSFSAAGCFYSAPASPAQNGRPGTADEYGCEMALDFDFQFEFEFSSRCPSPAAAAMSSADELFHNGQIRPMRLASFLLRPQALPPLDGDVTAGKPLELAPEGADERGRLRSRSSVQHRRYRSLSPFRAHWLSPSSSSSPAPAAKPVDESAAAAGEAAPSASRSSSSSSTASSASSSSFSSSSRNYYRRWRFLKDILHRSKSDGEGERPPLPSDPSPLPTPKRNPSPSPAAASRGSGRARRSAHARLYEARRAEAEEMRRRTFLPYRQGLVLGCLGLGSRGYGAMHSLAAAAGKARP